MYVNMRVGKQLKWTRAYTRDTPRLYLNLLTQVTSYKITPPQIKNTHTAPFPPHPLQAYPKVARRLRHLRRRLGVIEHFPRLELRLSCHVCGVRELARFLEVEVFPEVARRVLDELLWGREMGIERWIERDG